MQKSGEDLDGATFFVDIMDYQHRPGQKTGTGAMASAQDLAQQRRDRLRKLAMETIDLRNDPYLSKNRMGQLVCKLCLSIHATEGGYLAHTQTRAHQMNLARRVAKLEGNAFGREASSAAPYSMDEDMQSGDSESHTNIFGVPEYKVDKVHDRVRHYLGFVVTVDYSKALKGSSPAHRVSSTYEQRMEPVDEKCQYLLLACAAYETIAIRVPVGPVDVMGHWDPETKRYRVQLLLKGFGL